MSIGRLTPTALLGAEGAGGEPVSALRINGGEGTAGAGGAPRAVPGSQSHRERLRGRRAMPSHEGGALDKLAQPQSGEAITHRIVSRTHIFSCTHFSPGASDAMAPCRLLDVIAFGQAR
jgi:hypothetical protein